MGAASHLGIDLREYDSRIRSFIPGYEDLLDAAAGALAVTVRRNPVIVDLGTGTGALASRCLAVKPPARIVGVDEDEGMLAVARQRVGRSFTGMHGSFERVDLPACDAVTASLALHHLPTPARRARAAAAHPSRAAPGRRAHQRRLLPGVHRRAPRRRAPRLARASRAPLQREAGGQATAGLGEGGPLRAARRRNPPDGTRRIHRRHRVAPRFASPSCGYAVS